MTSISVTLPDERAKELKELAARLGVEPEALLRAGIEDLLSRPGDECTRAMELVLRKNAELYKRLA